MMSGENDGHERLPLKGMEKMPNQMVAQWPQELS